MSNQNVLVYIRASYFILQGPNLHQDILPEILSVCTKSWQKIFRYIRLATKADSIDIDNNITKRDWSEETPSKTNCLYPYVRQSSLKYTQVCSPKYKLLSSPE